MIFKIFTAAADDLRNLMLQNNLTHSASSQILKYLNKYNMIGMQLPSDSRTFLSTQRTVPIVRMESNEFSRMSFQAEFTKCTMEVRPIFNMNGLPLHKSSKKDLWPILCEIDILPEKPVMAIAAYMRESKPNINAYLEQFVTELGQL